MLGYEEDSCWRKLDEEMLDEWDEPTFEPFKDTNGKWVDSQHTLEMMEYYGVDTVEELDSYLDSID